MSKVKTKTTKTKTKTKTKAKIKKKITSKAKTKVKTAKAKDTTKKAPKVKTKNKTKTKVEKLNDKQKEALLIWIEKIVNLHKRQKGSLKSLTRIDEILNKYNQRYTEIDEKFDAIAEFGIEKDPRVIHKHFFVNIEGREKEVDDLYILLTQITKGEVNFSDAKETMKSIYEKSLAVNR
jgi:hypothetical protein